MGFPTQVNVVQAPAVAGDFASTNPHISVDAGPGAFVAAAAGCAAGLFAWLDAAGQIAANTGTGAPVGFVSRRQQGLITTFLADSTMIIPQGLPVTLFNGGDFWAKNDGAVAATIGMKAYALNANGKISFNVTATPPVSATDTGATLARIISAATGGALPTTNTCTASISGTTMTVTAVGAGCVLGAGQTLTGTGLDPAAITSVVAQLTGTAGSTGTYQVSLSQTVTSTTVTMSGGGLTLTGGNTSGVFAPGMSISGTNIPAGCVITGYGTATAGGAGTYTTNLSASTAATASTVTATNAMYLTISGASSGAWQLNDLLVGTTVSANQSINATASQNANLTGLGGAGTYLTNVYQAALTSQTISVNAGTETKWIAQSAGAIGELVKISSNLLG